MGRDPDRSQLLKSVTIVWHGLHVEIPRHYPAERLVAYDVGWPSRYRAFATGLLRSLGPRWEIEHVGSTSVPGLVAKPVIDLALRLPVDQTLEQTEEGFVQAGWTPPVCVGDHWATFLLDDGVRTGIGHLFTADQWDKAHVRLFACWLREHPVDRDRYARLKNDLVDRGVWGADYTAAKTGFVRNVVNLARADRGLPPQPTSNWVAASLDP